MTSTLSLRRIAAAVCIICCGITAAMAGELRVGTVYFAGNQHFTERQLARTLKLRWPDGLFDRDTLKSGLTRLSDHYFSRGFNDFIAEYVAEPDTAAGRVDIRLYLTEGTPYVISNVEFSGNQRLSTAQLLGSIGSRPGLPYNVALTGLDDFKLMMLYADYGLIFAEAEHRTEIGDDHAVRITFRINEGAPVTIGNINITGNHFVKRQAVLRELTIAPGMLFSRRELDRSQSQLIATGLVRSATVAPGALQEDGKRIDVDITLDERPRRRFESGIGYGSGDAVRITSAWSNRDLDGWGKRLEFSGQWAFQLWSRFRLVRGLAQASYLDPWLLGKRRPASVNVYYDDFRPAYTDYRLQTIGANLKTGFYTGSYLNAGTIWKQEWLRLSTNWSIPQNAADTLRYHGRRSVTLYSGYERTLDPVNPIHGLRGDAAADYAGGWLGGVNTFQRLTATLTAYGDATLLPLQVTARLRCGIIGDWSRRHEVPVYEKYYLGGPATLRGFALGMAGPHDAAGLPTGGDKMVMLNLEAKVRVYGKWMLAGFGDAGLVSNRSLRRVSLSESRGNPGWGVRRVFPFGAARLDFAAPLSQAGRLKKWRMIVAWGEAF